MTRAVVVVKGSQRQGGGPDIHAFEEKLTCRPGSCYPGRPNLHLLYFGVHHVTSVAHACPDRLGSAPIRIFPNRNLQTRLHSHANLHATGISDATWSFDAGLSASSSDGMACAGVRQNFYYVGMRSIYVLLAP